MLSLICISSLYLLRFILSFKESPFPISKYIYIPFQFGLFLQLILAVIIVYLALELWSVYTNDTSTFMELQGLQQLLATIWMIFGTFNIIMALCATFVAFIFNFCRLYFENDTIDTNEVFLIYLTMGSFDIFCNSLSVDLQFKHSNNIYGKLCGCCHYLVSRIMNKMNISPQSPTVSNDCIKCIKCINH